MGAGSKRSSASDRDPAERLWQLWENGERPDVAAFLAPLGELTPAQLVALLRVDQSRCWAVNDPIRAETYLQEYPALRADIESAVELIYAEFLLREELGESPSEEEYLRRFPEFRARLHQQIELHCALDAEARSQDLETVTEKIDEVKNTGKREYAPPSSLALPAVAGYEIIGELGRGGMGVVYKAWHIKLRRVVALKMVPAADADAIARFRNEAEAVARLQHPHVVQIHEIGEQEGRPFLALEYVDGGSLADRLRAGPIPNRQAAEMVEKIARAIHDVHQKGLIHRDLKPGNILLKADGTPKVTDFGLAKLVVGGVNQTQAGSILGTPSYMAPEQAGGGSRAVGPPADVYALGAILYELLTGRPPFRGQTIADVVRQVLNDEAVTPRRLEPKVPRDLETICLKCLEKDPAKRYTSAADLAEDLRRHLADEPILARRISMAARAGRWAKRRPAVAALIAVTLVAAVGFVGVNLWYQGRLEKALADTVLERDDARVAKGEAEVQRDEARQNLYFSNLPLAQRAWETSRVERVLDLLEKVRPHRARDRDLRHFEWHYLRRLCHADLRTLTGHTGPVTSVAFHPQGKQFASAAADGTIRIWDVDDGRELRVLREHMGRVTALAYSPDGERLASTGEDKTITVWATANGHKQHVLLGHTGWVYSAAFSPDGQRIATVSADGTAKIWNADDGELQTSFDAHNGRATTVAFSPDHRWLATGGSNHEIRIYDAATTKGVHRIKAHAGWVYGLAFSPDSKQLASVSFDAKVKIWDPVTGEKLHELKGHTDQIRGLAFSPDGGRLASAGYDQTVRIWDTAKGEPLLLLKGHLDHVNSVAFHPDGRRLVSAGEDRLVKIWDTAKEQESLVVGNHAGAVTAVAFSADGKWLGSASGDRTIRVGVSALNQEVWSREVDATRATAVAFSPDGKFLASAGAEPNILLWAPATGKRLGTLVGHTDRVTGLAFGEKGNRLASVSYDGTLKIWEPGAAKETSSLLPQAGRLLAVAFSTDGQRVACGGIDKIVRIWNPTENQGALAIDGHGGWITALAFSPNDQWLASASVDATIRIWDAATGKPRHKLQGHGGRVSSIAFSPDGNRLASASWDGTVRLWDLERGQELLALKHGDEVHGVAFSPDGYRLASACRDQTIHLWDATPLLEP